MLYTQNSLERLSPPFRIELKTKSIHFKDTLSHRRHWQPFMIIVNITCLISNINSLSLFSNHE